MVLKGTYKQAYILDREAKELVVVVELKKVEGMIEAGQNLWYGVATANGKEIKHKSLPTCVNAKSMANRIGKEIIESWKKRAKKENKSFRLKKK